MEALLDVFLFGAGDTEYGELHLEIRHLGALFVSETIGREGSVLLVRFADGLVEFCKAVIQFVFFCLDLRLPLIFGSHAPALIGERGLDMLLLGCDVNELVSFILVLIKEMVVLSLEAEICTVFRMGFHKGLQVDHAVGNGRWRRLLGFLSLHPLTAREHATRRAAAMVYTQFLYFMRRPYFCFLRKLRMLRKRWQRKKETSKGNR